MKAAQILAPQQMKVVETPTPEPGFGEVLLRIETCGVCASNVPVWEGREWFSYPQTPGALGHEATGIIEELGDGVAGLHLGQRVAALSYQAYAEYDIASAAAVVPLPSELEGTVFPGEPLACAMNIFKRAHIQPGQTVAIVGIGFLGAVLTQLATQAGAHVVALARREYALQLARQLGATETISLHDGYAARARVRELTQEQWCPVVIEAVGKQEALDLAADLTGVRGRLVIAGYHQDGLRSVNLQQWNWRGIDVINAHERDPQVYLEGLHAAVEAVRTGQLKPQQLCTHEFPLAGLGEALELTRQRPEGFMKAIIRP